MAHRATGGKWARAETGPAGRRLSRSSAPERAFLLPLLRRGRTASFFLCLRTVSLSHGALDSTLSSIQPRAAAPAVPRSLRVASQTRAAGGPLAEGRLGTRALGRLQRHTGDGRPSGRGISSPPLESLRFRLGVGVCGDSALRLATRTRSRLPAAGAHCQLVPRPEIATRTGPGPVWSPLIRLRAGTGLRGHRAPERYV